MTYPFPDATDDFEDKRVLVTGGTKGTGEAIVRRFLLAGASVVTTGRSALPAGQHPTLFVQADVSSIAGAEMLANLVQCEWGGIDILVNNAGGSRMPNEGFQVLSEEDWQRALNTNLLAAVRMNRAFVPGMIERGGGVVLHVASFQQRLPPQEVSLAYACAQTALSTYNKGLANEVGPKGVRVNMISQAPVETLPIGRPGTLEEVVELVAFLASDRGASIHGVDYVIERGTLPPV